MSPVVDCRGLHFHYPDGQAGLDGVDLRIEAGERWGIVGATGSGKSTLLVHLAGLYPAEGHLWIFQTEATRGNLPAIRAATGLVFQEADDQLFLPTLREDIAFGLLSLGLPPEEVRARIGNVAGRLRLDALLERPPHHLSGGEKRAAALATIIARQPKLLLLDEPSNDLDPAARRDLIQFLSTWEGALVIATHDLELLLETVSSIAIMSFGRIVELGAPRELFRREDLMKRYRLEVPPTLRK